LGRSTVPSKGRKPEPSTVGEGSAEVKSTSSRGAAAAGETRESERRATATRTDQK